VPFPLADPAANGTGQEQFRFVNVGRLMAVLGVKALGAKHEAGGDETTPAASFTWHVLFLHTS
jgi:hypothetical protein